MTIKNVARYKIITDIIQTSFGKSSEVKYVTHFLSAKMPLDDTIEFSVAIRVNFPDQSVMLQQRAKYRREALAILASSAKKIEAEYKETLESRKKLGDDSVATKQPYEKEPQKAIKITVLPDTIRETIEYISVANPSKQAIFTVKCLAKVD